MKTHNRIAAGILMLSAGFGLVLQPGDARAQSSYSSAAAPRIDGFDVEPVRTAAPGGELAFTLYGSPGGAAQVQISGATTGLALAESEPGVYEGIYTIRTRDKITAASTANVNLRLGNRVASAILDEPLVGGASTNRRFAAASAAAPQIDRFEVDPPARLAAGEELNLMLSGTPGGTASARIAGVKGKLVMSEIRPGVYEGSHTIANRDRIAPNAVVTGTLRVADKETSAVLGQPLLARSGYQASARQAAKLCANCGVVEAINVVEVKGEGTYLGKIGGGLAGVLLGSQVGHGTGTTVAEVAGGAGGAFLGNELEKKMKTTKHYEALVRLENGGTQTVSYAAQPGFAVGAKVKIENGALVVM